MKIIKLIKEEKKYIILQVIFDLIGVSCLAVAPLIQKNFFDTKLTCIFYTNHLRIFCIKRYKFIVNLQ